jgi:hypothetical protein
MAHSIQGFGTTFYGKRDFRADGTYVTTEWIVLFFIPIIPIRSLRVYYHGQGKRHTYVETIDKYSVYEKTSPYLKQVFFTYGFVCILFLWAIYCTPWIFFTCRLCDLVGDTLTPYLIMLSIFAPAVIPYILRRDAKRRLRA